jgi:hypothetical protein
LKRSEAVRYFKSVKGVALALNISVPAVRQWQEDRIPILRQLALHRLSGGALQVDPDPNLEALQTPEPKAGRGSEIDKVAADLVEAFMRYHQVMSKKQFALRDPDDTAT